jgi:hypothetical protein
MRSPPRTSLVPTLAAFAAVAMLVAACACAGGSSDGARSSGSGAPGATSVAQSALTWALEATRAVQSGRVEVTTTITDLDDEPDPPPGGRLTVATYLVAFDRRVARVEVQADLPAAEGAAGGDLRAGDAARREARPAARMIADGGMVYAQGGLLAAAVGRPPGDWVAVERGAFRDRRPSGDVAALLLDPLGPFGVLGDATGDARVVGHDVIRGSPVTHMATHADSGGSTAQVDAWIDADGVIRRMEIGLIGAADAAGATGPTGAGGGRVVTTVELFDVDRAVAITPPGEER